MSPKVLLVIDAQNGFIKGRRSIKIAKKIEKLVASGYFDYVIASQYINHKGSPTDRLLNWSRLSITDTEDIALFGKLQDTVNWVYSKDTYNCINQEFIKHMKATFKEPPLEIYIVGFNIDCCVLATSFALFDMGIRPIILTDYCGTTAKIRKIKPFMNKLFRFNLGNNPPSMDL